MFFQVVVFVEFDYLRTCGSSNAKKMVEVGSDVNLAEVNEVDNVSAHILSGVISLCTLKEWLSHS